jgi:hypothetical protein
MYQNQQSGGIFALVVFLPFVGTTFSHISRVLSKHNIKTVAQVFTAFPASVSKCIVDKPDIWLRQRLNNITDICLYQPEKSAVAEQCQPRPLHTGTEYHYSGEENETDKMDLKGTDRDCW